MNNTTMNTASFDFCGDKLAGVHDNVTGETYVAVESILVGIGFSGGQIGRIQAKWATDPMISKGMVQFKLGGGEQKAYYISSCRLPIALAKINITSAMKQKQPQVEERLNLYIDKCAEMLAGVFDGNSLAKLMSLTSGTLHNINATIQMLITQNQSFADRIAALEGGNDGASTLKSECSSAEWYRKMRPKYNALMSYYGVSCKELYRNLFVEFQNRYPHINLNREMERYRHENGGEDCYTMNMIRSNEAYKTAFEEMVDCILAKNNIVINSGDKFIKPTIFSGEHM